MEERKEGDNPCGLANTDTDCVYVSTDLLIHP